MIFPVFPKYQQGAIIATKDPVQAIGKVQSNVEDLYKLVNGIAQPGQVPAGFVVQITNEGSGAGQVFDSTVNGVASLRTLASANSALTIADSGQEVLFTVNGGSICGRGHVSNLVVTCGTSQPKQISVTADAVVVYDGTNIAEVRNFSATCDATVLGVNGSDVGPPFNFGSGLTVSYLYVIAKPGGANPATLLSGSYPPTFPTGYTMYRVISEPTVYGPNTGGLSGFVPFVQQDDLLLYTPPVQIISAVNPGTTYTAYQFIYHTTGGVTTCCLIPVGEIPVRTARFSIGLSSSTAPGTSTTSEVDLSYDGTNKYLSVVVPNITLITNLATIYGEMALTSANTGGGGGPPASATVAAFDWKVNTTDAGTTANIWLLGYSLNL